MQGLTESNEYRENADRDPDHYLVLRVGRMREMAPGLQRYEQVKLNQREDLIRVKEMEQVYSATCEALK